MATQLLSVRVPAALHRLLCAYAEERGLDISTAVRQVLAAGLDRIGLADDVQAAVRAVLPSEVQQATSAATETQTRVVRRAVVFAVATAYAAAHRLGPDDTAALAAQIQAALEGAS